MKRVVDDLRRSDSGEAAMRTFDCQVVLCWLSEWSSFTAFVFDPQGFMKYTFWNIGFDVFHFMVHKTIFIESKELLNYRKL